jgi:hypothetical protein
MSELFKNDASRRGLLRAGLMIVAGSAAAVAATAARADDNDSKVDQSVVQYQTSPKDGAQCSGCVNFVAPNACKVVKGVISPNGWCVAFAPKGS